MPARRLTLTRVTRRLIASNKGEVVMPYLRRSIASLLVILIAGISFETCAQMPGGGRGRPDGGRAEGGRQQGGAARSETRAVPTDLVNLLEYRLETMQEDL